MRAVIEQIPPAEESTWGAVLATLLRNHPTDWNYHWKAHQLDRHDSYSVIDIRAPGEDVAELRAEIEAVVDLVNEVARRDPLNKMVQVDVGHVEVLVD
ncbi:MAG TPA: hypothetical protein VLK30_06500 [Candidatus Limnocylindrales bacterium]|nr:hypothetical protein [Candidatus Limnocylindrales bacterium]